MKSENNSIGVSPWHSSDNGVRGKKKLLFNHDNIINSRYLSNRISKHNIQSNKNNGLDYTYNRRFIVGVLKQFQAKHNNN